MYEPRWYRQKTDNERFTSFQVEWLETDLWIGIDKESFVPEIPDFIFRQIKYLRVILDSYIDMNSSFRDSLSPIPDDIHASEEIRQMIKASTCAEIGPMSAVAGLFAEFTGKSVVKKFVIQEIVIENGGDLYISIKKDIDILVYAGNSPLSNKIAVTIPHRFTPLGLCTSSGTVGHSLSFGKADAVMVACTNAALADSLATRFGNEVKTPADIEPALKLSESFDEILSILIIIEDKIGVKGKFGIKPYKKE
jgi:ApbE superfamily uncharacterized protein (UPF0280 family)